jgi:hypothetical protein
MSSPRTPATLALLLSLAALLLIGSGLSYYLLQTRLATPAHALPSDALYRLALDVGPALGGDAAALLRFEQSQKMLEESAARDAGAPYATDPRFTRLVNNAGAVVRARTALTDAGTAARDT